MDTETIITAVATLVVGVVVGYLVRSFEFRRDRRLDTYDNLVSAFLAVCAAGAGLQSAALALGDRVHDTRDDDRLRHLWEQWDERLRGYEAARGRVLLVATDATLGEAERLDDYIRVNLRDVPPLHPNAPPAEWGPEARQSPRKVEEQAHPEAARFADVARREIVPQGIRWPWRRP